jgi:subtilisin-like proprotein convertase family protein
VAALVISVNQNLKGQEVRDIMKRACDRIDPQGGNYNGAGHSSKYGFGRLNARTAVDLAKPQPQNAVTISRTFDAPIPDLQTVSFQLDVPDNAPVASLTASVDLKHTFIGDLVITLKPPASTGVAPIVLHDRAGGSTKNLKKTYDSANTPKLAGLAGKSCNGSWALEIRDAAAVDSGTLTSFSLGLTFPHT